MSYSLAIFDLDGTLADSFPWFVGVLNTVARKFAFREVAEGEIEPLRHGSTHDILRKLEAAILAAARSDEVREQLKRIGLEPSASASAEFGAQVKRDIGNWAGIINALGVTAQ